MKGEREVAGLWCREVLAELSAYLDGELTAERRAHIEGHVKGCDACTRMGGEVASIVSALKKKLGATHAPRDVVRRLDDVLAKL